MLTRFNSAQVHTPIFIIPEDYQYLSRLWFVFADRQVIWMDSWNQKNVFIALIGANQALKPYICQKKLIQGNLNTMKHYLYAFSNRFVLDGVLVFTIVFTDIHTDIWNAISMQSALSV